MGIQLEHRRLSFARVSGQGMAEVNTQRSCALPADCPDMSDAQAEAVLWAQGMPIVKSAEPMEGQVKVSGRQIAGLYSPGRARFGGEVSIDDPRFEVVIPAPGVRPDDAATAEVMIAHFGAESTGARTLQLTAALAVSPALPGDGRRRRCCCPGHRRVAHYSPHRKRNLGPACCVAVRARGDRGDARYPRGQPALHPGCQVSRGRRNSPGHRCSNIRRQGVGRR